MVEADHIVTQVPAPNHAQRLAQRQAQAVLVLAMYAAKRDVKDAIRREGKVKLSRVPQHELVAMARARLFEDAEYRARLIAEARPIVDQWTAEGFFGKLAAQRHFEQGAHHKEKCEGTILTGHTLAQSVTTSPQPSGVSQ
jgi:hypothetical protein